jgi:hypothetical protein
MRRVYLRAGRWELVSGEAQVGEGAVKMKWDGRCYDADGIIG